MPTDPKISVRCFAAPAALRTQGIRCFARVVIEDTISVDGLAVRRTQRGDYIVTWPERRDGRGRSHAVVRLLDPDSRAAVESAVLAEAANGGWIEVAPQRHGGAS
jgi:DNA-binding cell septation regulator SpoVG